jgi:hypothetical protein
MQNDAPDQLCPFCGRSWGTCDHYRILSEWEEIAEVSERTSRRRKTLAAEDVSTLPLEGRHLS